jgi:hypothetical protein
VTLPRRTLLLLATTAALAACRSEDPRSSPPPPQLALPPTLERATQADLARELDDADRRGSWNEVKRRWQGQTLRWTVIRQQALCRTAESCNVAAFPIQRPALVGWLPTLRFAPGQFEALAARCGDRAQCEVTIEGKLERLTASAEQPTSLELTGVRIVGAAG